MRRAALLAAASALALTGCAAPLSSTRYSASQVGSVNRAVEGTIVSVRAVTVDRSTGIGGAAGAGIGAAGGASLGSNAAGSVAGAIAGAVVGGIAGAALEHSAAKTPAYEYVVRTNNGALITLVQGEPALASGARVIVIYGSPARMIAAPTP